MHRERLQTLSDQELLKIAEEQNIMSLGSFDREFLIEEIYSTLVDPFHEENLSVRLLAKRYEFGDEFGFNVEIDQEAFLEQPPHENHLYIAVHSPQWLFVDWHVAKGTRDLLSTDHQVKALFLRLYVLEKSSMGYELCETLDVEVESFNGRQYLTLPNYRAHYRVILIAEMADRERVLLESAITFAVGHDQSTQE